MILSNERNGLLEINAWPQEIEEKLISLEPGDVIKVRVNPDQFFTVFEQKGTSQDNNRPTSSGTVRKIAEVGVPSPWSIRIDRRPYQVGFLEGYDSAGKARYAHPIFNQMGEMTFRGDKIGDRERFFVMQLHPQMKIDVLTVLERRNWKFEIVDPEKENTGISQNFEAKLSLMNKIKDLDDSSLNILMSSSTYDRVFFGQPAFVNKTKASRMFLIKKVEENKMKEISDAFKLLDEVNKIQIVYDGLTSKKLICTENKLTRYDGKEITTFAEPIGVANNQEAAINIFRYASHLPEFNDQVIEFLRETYEGAKTTANKAKR
jgi:hypothetical protein